MVEQFQIKIAKRTGLGTAAARKLRATGSVPGMVYGEKGENIPVTVDPDLLNQALQGGHRLVALELEGKKRNAVIREIQYDHLGKDILHVDFERVAAGHKITLTVPLELHGTAPGVKLGGVLDFSHRELHIRCLPSKVPELILVEIGEMNITDVVRVGELQAHEGVEVLDEPDTPVVSIHPPRAAEEVEEEAAEEAEGAAPAEPEVVGRKAEEEGEDADKQSS